jgi:hypothetical protein
MKKNIVIILLFSIVEITLGQDTIITREFTRSIVDEKIDFSKVYHRKTGEKIAENDFVKMVKNNPNLQS